MREKLCKIFRPAEWQNFKEAGIFAGSAHDLRDGYIHLCSGDQLAGTLAKHYAPDAGVIVAEIDAAKLGAALRWEPATEGRLYPHLYASLRVNVVLRAVRFVRGADGLHAAEAVAR